MSRKVLVVGGAGYIGSHCTRDLEEAGDVVVVFDDLSTHLRSSHRVAHAVYGVRVAMIIEAGAVDVERGPVDPDREIAARTRQPQLALAAGGVYDDALERST